MIDKYHQDGFLIVDNIFNSSECDLIIMGAEWYADENFKEIHNLEKTSLHFNQVVKFKKIVSLLEVIHGSKMVCLGSLFHFRRPGTPFAESQWLRHQDNAYVRAPHGMMCTVHVALTDSEAENGGVWIAQGSHREPILPHWPALDYTPPFTFKPKRFIPAFEITRRYLKVPINLKKGSICIQHGHAIHGSYPNHSERSREHFGIMYCVKDAPFNAGLFGKREAMDV